MRYLRERPESFLLKPDHQLAQGLVFAGLGRIKGTAHYRDSSPYGNHGTLTNMEPSSDWVWDSTLNRFALDFDGSDDYVACNGPIKYANPNIITLAAWVYTLAPVTGARKTIFGCDNEASVVQLEFTDDDTFTTHALSVIISGVFVADISRAYTAGWHHMAYTRCGTGAGTHAFYLDGVIQALVTDTANNFVAGTVATKLGRRASGSQMFNSRLSDPLAYERCLSPVEIQQLADPSNVMLSGLIVPPKRKLYGFSPQITTSRYLKVGKLLLTGN